MKRWGKRAKRRKGKLTNRRGRGTRGGARGTRGESERKELEEEEEEWDGSWAEYLRAHSLFLSSSLSCTVFLYLSLTLLHLVSIGLSLCL